MAPWCFFAAAYSYSEDFHLKHGGVNNIFLGSRASYIFWFDFLFYNVLKQVPISFSCLDKYCSAVLPWHFRMFHLACLSIWVDKDWYLIVLCTLPLWIFVYALILNTCNVYSPHIVMLWFWRLSNKENPFHWIFTIISSETWEMYAVSHKMY